MCFVILFHDYLYLFIIYYLFYFIFAYISFHFLFISFFSVDFFPPDFITISTNIVWGKIRERNAVRDIKGTANLKENDKKVKKEKEKERKR